MSDICKNHSDALFIVPSKAEKDESYRRFLVKTFTQQLLDEHINRVNGNSSDLEHIADDAVRIADRIISNLNAQKGTP